MSASDGALARVLEGVSRWMLTHRVVVVLTAVIWVVVSSLGLGRLGFKNDYRMFFSTENPELLAFESLQRTFTKADNILIAVTPRQGDLPTRERLGAIEALTNQTWQLPGATRVDSITNFQDSFAEGDEIVVQDMARRAATLSDEQIARIRQRILAEPLIVGRLINKAGTVTGINVMFEFDDDDKDAAVVRAANAARELVARARQSYPDLEFRLTGGVMLDAAFSDSAEADIKFLTPVMLTVSIGLIAYFLGSLWATLVTTAVISGSVLCALGWAGYLGIALSPSSLAAPTILMTMAVADSVHFLTGYYTRLETTSDRVEAMIHSLVSHIPAVFFTSAATIASFLTLNFSDAPPFRDLGNITAMGVGAAFVLSLTLLPAVITFVPVAHARRRFEGLKRFLERVFTLIERVPQRIAVVGIIACLLLTALAFFNRIDDRYVQYFGESLSFRQDTDYVDANLTGIYAIEYPLKAQGPDGINDPGFLRDVEAFGAWLRTQPEVTHVYSVADILKKLNMNMNGDDPAFYRMPDNRKLAAQYLLTYELSLPQGVNLIDRVDVNRSAIRLTATLRNVSSQQVLDLEERAQAWMKQHMPAYMHVAGTGASLMFAHIGQRNILAMISGELMGMALVSLLMILYLRSLSLGLLSMIPNLLPAGVAIGIWYLAVGEVGLTSSVVAAMTLGILTDDTVHFLEKYARYHRTMAVRDAVARAFQEAGPAIWITSLVLISGFAVLALSSFQINSDLGILTVIILALGLVGDFVLLPAVLLSLESVRKAAFTVPRHLNSRESVMKVLIFAAGLASAGLLAGPSLIAQTPEERGLSIAVETDARDAGFGNWLASAKMVLRDKQGGEAVRTFRMMALEQKDDGDKTLVVFDKPADLAGAAVLTYSHALVPDDQWLYLPEVRRVKRISAQNKAALFMGSEFAYEDLSSWEVKKYGYKYLRDETIDGEDCFVVENTPAYADSAYSKQIEWVDKKLYHPRRLDYYDRQGRLLKTMTFSGYQQYLGKHWRASEQLMRNHQTGKATQIVWGPYKFKTTIHESEFTPEALTRSR